jgi:hypothetical protein
MKSEFPSSESAMPLRFELSGKVTVLTTVMVSELMTETDPGTVPLLET